MNFKKFKEIINNYISIEKEEDYKISAYYTEDIIHIKNREDEIVLIIDLSNETVTYKL